MKLKKIAVTGGAGFVGSAIVGLLVERGAEVVVIDSFVDGTAENVPPGVTVRETDVRDERQVSSALADVTVVFHHAALASVPRCSENPRLAFEVNVGGTINVLEALRLRGDPAARVVLASSAAVYGSGSAREKFTETHRRRPFSMYATTKTMAEDVVLEYARSYALDARIVRYCNVYGPRQSRYIVYDLYHKIKAAVDEIAIIGNGKQRRDFVYVADAAIKTIEFMEFANPVSRVLNIASGRETNVVDLAKIVCEEMGRPNLRLRLTQSSWVGDIDCLLADPSLCESLFGLPTTDLRTGVDRFIEWMETRSHKTPLRAAAQC